jgi:hypothetical protein
MTKTTFFFLLLFCSLRIFAQNDFFILKKGSKSIQSFQKDSHITFQLTSRQWVTGYISKIQNDSFYVRPEAVHYTMMGTDTVHFTPVQVAITDVYAMPRKKEQVVFVNDQPRIIYGSESLVYVKNGLLFQLGGGGYVILNLLNSLFKKDRPFAHKNSVRLCIGSAIFLLGEVLHLSYTKTLPIGKKYHFEYIPIKN